jgi:hypothetical protein
MSNFIVNTDIPNLRVVIREGDQYNINVIPGRITTARTGSFNTYADLAGQVVTASYALTAETLLGTINSASYAVTASYVSGASSNWNDISEKPTGLVSSSTQVDYTQLQNQPTIIPTASYVLTAVSSSFAITASYVSGAASTWDSLTNKPSGLISSSAQVDYTQLQNQPTIIPTASYVLNAISSSFAITASYVSGTVSTWNGITEKPTGLVSSSIQINTGSFTGSFTGQFTGTSSWANNSISSSFSTTASFAVSSSRTVTASFAITSSYATNADLFDGLNSTVFATTGSNVFNGNQTITGSLFTNADTLIFTGSLFTSGSVGITGSLNVSAGITGSLFGSSSFSTTASSATSITFIPITSSYSLTSSYIDGGRY